MTRPLELRPGLGLARRKAASTKRREYKGGASIVPTKGRIDWPYVALPVAIVVVVASALHLLSAWVASVIFAVLWVFVMWSKLADDFGK
jgi:hypothetical protein